MKIMWPFFYGVGKRDKTIFTLALLELDYVIEQNNSFFDAVISISPSIFSFSEDESISLEEISVVLSEPALTLVNKKINESDDLSFLPLGKDQFDINYRFIEEYEEVEND